MEKANKHKIALIDSGEIGQSRRLLPRLWIPFPACSPRELSGAMTRLPGDCASPNGKSDTWMVVSMMGGFRLSHTLSYPYL